VTNETWQKDMKIIGDFVRQLRSSGAAVPGDQSALQGGDGAGPCQSRILRQCARCWRRKREQTMSEAQQVSKEEQSWTMGCHLAALLGYIRFLK
jgi:hypothetical protein